MLRNNWMIIAYLVLTIFVIYFFVGPIVLDNTPFSIVVGTLLATIGAVIISIIPAFFFAAALVGIFPSNSYVVSILTSISHILTGIPSIIIGVIGFIVFCYSLGFGWSILSAMLTLSLLLFPTLITAFVQLLGPCKERYLNMARSFDISGVEFLLTIIPRIRAKALIDIILLAWTTSLSDTAAVMLTCGALLEMPSSLLDSVRLLNYHIYLLAMEIPGGMAEAKSLSLLLIVTLLVLSFGIRLCISIHSIAKTKVALPG